VKRIVSTFNISSLLRLIMIVALFVAAFGLSRTNVNAESSAASSPMIGSIHADSPLDSKHVGIQAGHWQIDDVPDELAALRGQWGAVVGNVWEVDINLDIARRVANLLEDQGITVDVLPATLPPGYQADAFIALHADSYSDPARAGYKIARATASAIPDTDDALVQTISNDYGVATGMQVDPIISDDMTDYYAFNYRRFEHAIAPSTPAAILEMGFMTNPTDLQILLDSPDVVAGGIAQGITDFLSAQ
jgi:hypothetical protein